MNPALSPTEFAEKAGISISYASEILSGARRPSPGLARRIEERTGIPKHELRPDIFDAPSGGGATLHTPAQAGATLPAEPDFEAPTIECAICEAPARPDCRNRGCPHARKGA